MIKITIEDSKTAIYVERRITSEMLETWKRGDKAKDLIMEECSNCYDELLEAIIKWRKEKCLQ